VVARDGDPRKRERVEPRAGGRELGTTRALREVAAGDDDVGGDRDEVASERLRDADVVAAEVEVGDLREDRHVADSAGAVGFGASTRSAAGRVR
jgi:hypothetical protein